MNEYTKICRYCIFWLIADKEEKTGYCTAKESYKGAMVTCDYWQKRREKEDAE